MNHDKFMWRVGVVALIIFTCLWLLVPVVWSGVRPIEYCTPAPIDSVQILFLDITQTIAAGDTILDTTYAGSLPYVRDFPYSDDSSYVVRFRAWFTGASTYITSEYLLGKVAATATLGAAGAASIDSALTANHGSGNWSPNGDGTDTVVIYAVDTAGTDSLVSDVKLTVKNGAGTVVSVLRTDGDGNATAYLDNGSYTIYGSENGYYFPTAALTVTANEDSAAIDGYNVSIGTPGSADLCNVFGYIIDDGGNGIEGATITAYREHIGVITSGTAEIVPNRPVTVATDSTGLFELYLRKTGSFSDTTNGFYTIEGDYAGDPVLKPVVSLYVPNAASFNLADTVAGRQ